ncbi:unnamed protein product [Blepharisma stoltei]|uniref:Importin N-terminal domain-containing protein n=1 Tax=Blepharisma stoltei TaxID=1481888 RepID=A0AAU9KCX2_9CILI|nr:unnamed protein product [Blepharisma stoltei]
MISKLLLDAQSANLNLRSQALSKIEACEASDPQNFLLEVSNVLAGDQFPREARQLAAILIKNTVLNIKMKEQALPWHSFEEEITRQIKENCLASLASQDRDVRKATSQAVSAIAKQDIPKGKWNEVISIMVNNASHTNSCYKQAALDTLGYICEELDPSAVSVQQADSILTAIAANLAGEELSVRCVALQALTSSLTFYKSNIKNDHERQILLRLIFLNATHTSENVKILALRVLCEIAINFYECLEPNLMELGTVTYQAIQSEIPNISILGIEFWNLIADCEKEKLENDENPLGFITTAAQSLANLLIPKLLEIEEDSDEWYPAKGAYNTLCVISQICGDLIIDQMVPFIRKNISTNNLKQIVGALLGLSAICEGEPNGKLLYEIKDFTEQTILCLKSREKILRENSAWCLGRICKMLKEKMTRSLAEKTISALMEKFNDIPKVASCCAAALANIIESHIDIIDYNMSQNILSTAIKTLYREDSYQENLNISAFSVIDTLLENIPDSQIALLDKNFSIFIDILRDSARKPLSDNSYIFASSIIHVTCGRMAQDKIPDRDALTIIEYITSIFNARSTIYEEGIEALGSLAMNIGSRFLKYFQETGPFFLYALKMTDSIAVLKSGVLTIGDIATALGTSMSPYLNEIFPLLIIILESPKLTLDIKILCISSIGDILRAVGVDIIPYLPQVLTYLDSAAGASLQITGNEDVDYYLDQLRESILQFYIGLFQGLYKTPYISSIEDRLRKIISYVSIIIDPQFSPNNSIHAAALGLIGDILLSFPDPSLISSLQNYIESFSTHEEKSLSGTSRWVLSLIP